MEALPYLLGAVLMVGGTLRAYHFGWKRQDANSKRHKAVGVAWVVIGIFFVVSTILKAGGRR